MARNFGASDYITIAAAATPAHYSSSLAFWFRTTVSAASVSMVSQHSATSSNSGMAILINNAANDGKLALYGKNGTVQRGPIVTSTGGYNDGNWHHCVVHRTFQTGETSYIFIDGVQRASGSVSPLDNTSNLRIGRDADSFWGSFTGDIAEFAGIGRNGNASTYPSAAEITALAAGFTPDVVTPNQLVWYLPLVREVVDVANFKNHAQPTATGTTVSDHPRRIY